MVGRTGHTHASRNAVTLVWGSLRLAPNKTNFSKFSPPQCYVSTYTKPSPKLENVEHSGGEPELADTGILYNVTDE